MLSRPTGIEAQVFTLRKEKKSHTVKFYGHFWAWKINVQVIMKLPFSCNSLLMQAQMLHKW